MKLTRLMSALLLATMAANGPALANEIYRWTDAQGNVHYGDRPSGAASEERLTLAYNRRPAANTNAAARSENRATPAEKRAAREEAKQAAAEKRAEQEELKKKCSESRARLETYVTSQRLYRMDENGERVYLSDSELQQARERAEQLVAEYCNS